jgi:hypothetical protein
MYRTKHKELRQSMKPPKPKKTTPLTREFYVGTKRWQTKESSSVTDDLLKYTQYCFSLIYGLLSTRKCIPVEESPYEIILQFMCAIMKYNNVFYALVQMKRKRTDLRDLNALRYKVIDDADLYMAECVWYNDSDETFYFNARLIKLCLSYAHQNICIEFPPELLEHRVNFDYHSTQLDTMPIDVNILPEICTLFMIAEHAVLHLPEKNPDYISHKKTKKSPLFTFHTHIKFSNIGDLVSILQKKLDESERILSI